MKKYEDKKLLQKYIKILVQVISGNDIIDDIFYYAVMYFSRVFIAFILTEKKVLVRPHLHLKTDFVGPQTLGASVGSKPPAEFLTVLFLGLLSRCLTHALNKFTLSDSFQFLSRPLLHISHDQYQRKW